MAVGDVINPRLWWSEKEHRGIARHGRCEIVLAVPPPIVPHLAEIDFAPQLRTYCVRELGQASRDLTAGEILVVWALLARMEHGAVDPWVRTQ